MSVEGPMTASTVTIRERATDEDELSASLSGGHVRSWLDVPPWAPPKRIKRYQSELWEYTGFDFRLKILDRNRLTCPASWTREYQHLQVVKAAYRLLGFVSHPQDDDFDWAFGQLGVTRDRGNRRAAKDSADWYACRKLYFQRYESDEDAPRLGFAHPSIVRSPPGRPEPPDKFKSQWERRLAAALDRFNVRWDYEPDSFTYRDWHGRQRRYIPDFRLVDFARTYVEVKGRNGADAGDQTKMQAVLRTYPNLTLLLWDASVVEYIEEMPDPAALLGLLNTTNLRAA